MEVEVPLVTNELDEDYFKVAQRRIKEEMLNQKDMFGYAGVK